MSDPLADLAAVVAAGGERLKERLGCLVATATIHALQSSTARPAGDARAIAQAAFAEPKDAPG